MPVMDELKEVENKKKKKYVPRWLCLLLSVIVGVGLGMTAIMIDRNMEEAKKQETLANLASLNSGYEENESPANEVSGLSPEEPEEVSAEPVDIIEEEPVDVYVEPESDVRVCTVISVVANSYYYVDNESSVAETLSGGTQICVNGEVDGYFVYTTPNGEDAYISMDDAVEGAFYASYPDAVDLREVLPESEFDILFASEKNITGHGMYPAIPLLEKNTADLLLKAEELFEADGYRIKIYDAYRPKWAQYELYDIVQDNRYIANPYNGNSWHQLGRAVDMSLVEIATGEELEMPTPMHTFNSTASRYSSGAWSEAAKRNVDYMTEVMTSVGFGTIQTEWWHFEYKGSGPTLPPELDYTQITYVIG